MKLSKDYFIEGKIIPKGTEVRIIEKKNKKVLDKRKRKAYTEGKFKEKRNERRKRMNIKEMTRKDDVIDAIIRAFKEDLDVIVEYVGETVFGFGYDFKLISGSASNSESEWMVFVDEINAEKEAISRVKQDLEYESEKFNPSWLQNYIYMTDTDRRTFANKKADYRVGKMSNEDMLEEANMGQEYLYLQDEIEELEDELSNTDEEDLTKINSLHSKISQLEKKQDEVITSARDSIIEEFYNDIYDKLEDPYEYFVVEGNYTISKLMNSNIVSIDIEETSQDVVDTDGIAPFLDDYDGAEEEISDPTSNEYFLVYGTN